MDVLLDEMSYGFILGFVLFEILDNDLNEGVEVMLTKLASGITLGIITNNKTTFI